MATTMTGEAALPSGRVAVWAVLEGPYPSKTCNPARRPLATSGDIPFVAAASAGIGPVGSSFRGGAARSGMASPKRRVIPGFADKRLARFLATRLATANS